jgi:hypothetical protein
MRDDATYDGCKDINMQEAANISVEKEFTPKLEKKSG